MNLDILHSDNDLVIVNKPPGLLCVPGLSEPQNLFDDVKKSYPNARVVHRLDMATSGIVIFALNHHAQKCLGKQFEKRAVQKKYAAVVTGNLLHQHGQVSAPIMCDWDRRPIQKVDWLNGKWAETQYSVLDQTEGTTKVELKPITGRTHQLRVHMWLLGHPILGDKFYNKGGSDLKAERLLLHAEQISFTHPGSERPFSIDTAAPF